MKNLISKFKTSGLKFNTKLEVLDCCKSGKENYKENKYKYYLNSV